MKRRSVGTNGNGEPLRTETFCATACALYTTLGLSYVEIARRLHCDVSVIHRVARDHGWAYESGVLVNGVCAFPWTRYTESHAARLARRVGYQQTSALLGCKVIELVAVLVMNGQTLTDEPEYKMRKRWLTATLRAWVAELFEDGVPIRHIKFMVPGAHHDNIVRALKELDVYKTRRERMKYSAVRTPENEANIVSWYAEGYSSIEISSKLSKFGFQVPPSKVVLILSELGIERRINGVKAQTYRRFKEGFTYQDYREYDEAIRVITEINYKEYRTLIDPQRLRSPLWHVDHQLSVYNGFGRYTAPVEPVLVGHPANLRLLSDRENTEKGRRSSLTLRQLKVAVASFENTHGPVEIRL